jgi:thiol-disulfide isomerase/thioredoxin
MLPTYIIKLDGLLALGIWLLSGLFKRAAWLAAVACFSLFCCVTLYKGLTGAASCGCFGNVHVNPWVTLFAIDLPAVLALLLFRPKIETRDILNVMHWLQPRPTLAQFCIVFLAGLSAIAVSSPVLLLNEPKLATSQYEVLEPETWVGKELPIIDHIDIGEKLKTGNWLIMLYHYDCPNCAEAIPKIEQMAKELQGNEDVLRFALVEVPPYGPAETDTVSPNTTCVLGKLDTSMQWFVTTPALILCVKKTTINMWTDVPDVNTIIMTSLKKELSGKEVVVCKKCLGMI